MIKPINIPNSPHVRRVHGRVSATADREKTCNKFVHLLLSVRTKKKRKKKERGRKTSAIHVVNFIMIIAINMQIICGKLSISVCSNKICFCFALEYLKKNLILYT